MNLVFIITVAFGRSAQIARCLLEFHPDIPIEKHVIVQAHYPIDTERNNEEIRLIVDSYEKHCNSPVELWDPGGDIGSAQSQNWALKQLGLRDDDAWINLDGDSTCRDPHWMGAMQQVLEKEPKCAFVSLNSPMVQNFVRGPFEEKHVHGWLGEFRIGIQNRPMPFNMTMWRGSFINQIGEFAQVGPQWGEL